MPHNNKPAKLDFPDTRAWLIGALQELSDRTYQAEVWLARKPEPLTGQHSNLDYCMATLFDDGPNYRDPEDAIGSVLYDHDEVGLVSRVLDALDHVTRPRFSAPRTAEYLSLPEWENVVRAAKAAHDFLTERDKQLEQDSH